MDLELIDSIHKRINYQRSIIPNTMRFFLPGIALASFLRPASASIDTSNCVPIEQIGTSNLDRYKYSLDFVVDDDCSYRLSFTFQHDESLPVATSPDQCDPSITPPEIASDGNPYFAFRWAYASLPRSVQKATGIDHISIDFNPCGHPPLGVFTAPHYDFHIYRVSPEFRTCMTCTTVPGAPVCDSGAGAQETSNGRAFFNVNTIITGGVANMPSGFVVPPTDAVLWMGSHGWDVANQPDPATDPWTEPIWLMGSYDGDIAFYEPMVPLSYVTGSTTNFYEETIAYEGQTIPTLPNRWTLGYDAGTKWTTVTFEGESNVCNGMPTKKPKASKKASR